MSQLTIVTPVYEDREASSRLFRELRAAHGEELFIVAVDDGSVREPIDTQAISRAGLEGVVLRLKRNVGHQQAIAVGLGYVAENLPEAPCVVMDSDGEDLPVTIRDLLVCLDSENVDVAVAQRKSRVETFLFQAFYLVYRLIFRLLTGRYISFGNFIALTPTGVARLACMHELGTHIAGTVLSSKLRLAVCPIDRGPRYAGQSKMNFAGLVLHGFRAVMIFAEDVLIRTSLACIGAAMMSLFTIGAMPLLETIGWASPRWISVVLGIQFILLLQTSALSLMTLTLMGVVRCGSPIAPDYKLLIDKIQPVHP